jgi:hypothetical protein
LDVIGTKVLGVFLLVIHSHLLRILFPLHPLVQKWFETVLYNIKSENSQDYSQKLQQMYVHEFGYGGNDFSSHKVSFLECAGLPTSVGDPHVFGPPGSGSISKRCGSGFGSRSGSGSGSFSFLINVLSGLK